MKLLRLSITTLVQLVLLTSICISPSGADLLKIQSLYNKGEKEEFPAKRENSTTAGDSVQTRHGKGLAFLIGLGEHLDKQSANLMKLLYIEKTLFLSISLPANFNEFVDGVDVPDFEQHFNPYTWD